MPATTSLVVAQPKCQIFHGSATQIKLNFMDNMVFIEFEDRCDLWLIRDLRKSHKKSITASNRTISVASLPYRVFVLTLPIF